MKDWTALIVIGVILIILILYFAAAKGEKRKIQIINSEGTAIDVEVEIANTMTTRAKGLMGRTILGENEGMLFVFDKEERHSFWMLNTTIPLDAIHVSKNGTVVDILQMDPCTLLQCTSYLPKEKSRYVLEVNQGFSKKHEIEKGSMLVLNNIS
ncbi:DUF192 domain-containing protein [Candidatus Micrarchaeota archaeon]|nr:DUF192 domain-containing protein [Candidatus Micrarchaeota archaeon]